MAPRDRLTQEQVTGITAPSKSEVKLSAPSMSSMEQSGLNLRNPQDQHIDEILKHVDAIAALAPEQRPRALAALPKALQTDVLDKMRSMVDTAANRKAQFQAGAADILANWNMLNAALQSYEGLIRSRWLKVTCNRRKEILLTAWPNMPEGHRPDMENFLKGGRLTAQPNIDSYIWPYINLEDLLKPNALLILLNARGRNHPSRFARSDLELAPVFKTSKEVIAKLNFKATLSIDGATSPSRYGSWVEWEDEDSASQSIQSGRTMHVKHGSQILRIQARIMTFLSTCISQLLHDKNLTDLPPTLPKQPPNLSDQKVASDRMDIIARETPYKLPSQLDLTRIHALAIAQKSQAIDHVWALRKDPGYFASTAEEYREHRNELILDTRGNVHPHASDFPLYNKAVQHMAADAHWYVLIWDEICQHLANIRKLWTTHVAKISLGEDLPSELYDSLVEFRYFVEQVAANVIGDFGIEFRASPKLRLYHYRANPDDPNQRNIDVRRVKPAKKDGTATRLLRLMEAICHRVTRDTLTLHALLDEFEHLMQEGSHAKSLVSSHMAKRLSGLSILAECLQQLHLFQPWAHMIENDVEARKLTLAVDNDEASKYRRLVHDHDIEFED